MNSYFTNSALDLEALPCETIALETSHIEQAKKLGQQVTNEARRWQTYLNALALFGFEMWLRERAAELTVNWEPSSLMPPQSFNIIATGVNLQVGKFKFCLIVMGSLTEEEFYLSKREIDSPELNAHFYVAVEVMEELEEAAIIGFLRGDCLLENVRKQQLQADSDGIYKLPFSWWETNLDDLLLYLRFLEPAAISLANVQETPASFELVEKLKSLQQPAVNVWRWLQNEMDEFEAQLSWVLLPAFATDRFRGMNALGETMRSPMEELEAILTQLERRGTPIPSSARSAYQNLELASVNLRLYVVTWPLLSAESIPEWKLLLILGSLENSNLPEGTKMRVSDNTSVLVEQVAKAADAPYLYARVAGTWDEEFNVTIDLKNGETLALPPFRFHPN